VGIREIGSSFHFLALLREAFRHVVFENLPSSLELVPS